ncbi:hypothetical protein N692_05475 [Lactiplantibacillus plantarum EGD-AQ4]|nr:hypothetical protein N692_05475 [Lactiplantibacillus plantarum EGD-AQ4]
MAQLLLPLSLFGKTLPNGYMPLESYATISLLILCIGILIQKKRVKLSVTEFKYICFFSLLFVITQIITVFVSKIVQPQYTGASVSSILKSSTMLIAVCVLYYMIVTFMIQSSKDVMKFFDGIQIAMWMLLIICLLQLIYIQFGLGREIVNFIAGLFEERGGTAISTWYAGGSYAVTTGRINGLKQETGFLAAQLLIVFVPYLLTRLQQVAPVKRHRFDYQIWLPILLVIIILFQSGSTTAMLGLPIILVLIVSLLVKSWKRVFGAVLIMFLMLVVLMLGSKSFSNTVSKVVFDKFTFSNTSFAQRVGSAVTMIKIFLKSFGLGVGYNNGGKWSYILAPNFMRYNPEFNSYWPLSGDGFFAILSIITGWLAQFGIIFCGAVGYGVYRVLKITTSWLRVDESNTQKWFYTWYFRYFVAFLIFTSIMSFDWLHPLYIVVFLSMIRIFNVLGKNNLKEDEL